MAFVMSSLQHLPIPVTSIAMCHMPIVAGRTKKRIPKPKVAPLTVPVVPTSPPAISPALDSSALGPYISRHGLGPAFAHPHVAPEMLKTQRALDLGTPTDQQHSGRCWIFSSLNWLRQHVRQAYGADFQYSQNYIAYWDKVERAHTHFNRMMAAAQEPTDSREMMALDDLFTDGGTWEFFYNVVRKYGVVPDYAMPETRLAGNSQHYMDLLQRRVREIGGLLHSHACAQASPDTLAQIKAQGMQEVRRILDACLGTPPSSFPWREPSAPEAPWRQLTPQAFLQENPAKLDDMVFVTSYPQHEPRCRLVFDGVTNIDGAPVSRALNLPMDLLKKAIRRAVRAGEPVLSLSDTVSLDHEHDLWSLNTDRSLALLGIDAGLQLDKGNRVRYRVNGATHAMMFSGCDSPKGRKHQGTPATDAEAELMEPMWQVENSWGGPPMYMTDRWVDAYVYGIVINKAHLSAQARRWLEDDTLKTVHLPPWSPTRPTLSQRA